jgi:hypothetical protein
MAREDFKSVMVRNVEFKYPRLNQTYRYNTSEKRSEPCAPTASNASYSIAWVMPEDEARRLYADLKAHYESRKSSPAFEKVFGMKKNDDGTVEFKAKRNGSNADGKVNEPPRVIDGRKQNLEDTAIWSGSRGSIKVTAYPVTDPNGVGGISLLIDTVQVTHAVYGGGGLDDFDEVETTVSGGKADAAGHDDFDTVITSTAPANDPFNATAPATQPAGSNLDYDEIPF